MSGFKRSEIAILASITILALGPAAGWADEHQPESIVVHLSSLTDDLHAASMALKLGAALQKQGAKVTLFVDLEGVRVVDTRQPQDLRWGTSPTIAELFQAFVKSGAKILVCPHCAEAVGLDAESLRAGAKIGTSDEIVKLLAGASKILDY